MATQIIMPKLGMAMKDGIVGKWLRDDGAAVAEGEPIAIIVTKKITYELVAPAAGVLRRMTRPNATCPVGAIIGYVTSPGEAVPHMEGGALAPVELAVTQMPAAEVVRGQPKHDGERGYPLVAAPAPADGFVVASPAARRLAREAGVNLGAVSGSGPGGRVTEDDVRAYLEGRATVLITPAARRLAEEHALDITRIAGSGIGGRITEADVQRLIAAPQAQAPAPAEVPGRSIPFSGLRQAIAVNMVSSLHTMAQVTLSTEVDVTELVELRERLKKEFEVTYTDLIVKGVAQALRKHPRLNATLQADVIQLVDEVNIGVGVALDEGLIVPVIRRADQLGVRKIGERLRDLVAKAREDRLSVDEVTGGTYTVTNLGAYGIDAFTPVINPPEAAILGVGRIVEKLVLYRGEAARRAMMVLSLTFDHRLVDGAPAAAFLQTLADMLSHPYFLAA
jgi:pyruvate dehydrogenase E2 component (dihydrolipoamide acetyltransferase)